MWDEMSSFLFYLYISQEYTKVYLSFKKRKGNTFFWENKVFVTIAFYKHFLLINIKLGHNIHPQLGLAHNIWKIKVPKVFCSQTHLNLWDEHLVCLVMTLRWSCIAHTTVGYYFLSLKTLFNVVSWLLGTQSNVLATKHFFVKFFDS